MRTEEAHGWHVILISIMSPFMSSFSIEQPADEQPLERWNDYGKAESSSSLMEMVEAIAISPSDARELVAQYDDQARKPSLFAG
ncbi:hypothetical protein [Pseudomonas putida]